MNIDEYLPALRDAFIHHGVHQAQPRVKELLARLSLMDAVMDALHTDKVDLVILNEASPLLMHQVVKFGQVLYEDPVTRPAVDFYVYAAARYSDTAPTRKLAYRYLKEWLDDYRSKTGTTAPASHG